MLPNGNNPWYRAATVVDRPCQSQKGEELLLPKRSAVVLSSQHADGRWSSPGATGNSSDLVPPRHGYVADEVALYSSLKVMNVPRPDFDVSPSLFAHALARAIASSSVGKSTHNP